MKNSILLLCGIVAILGMGSCTRDCASVCCSNYPYFIDLEGFTDSDVTPLTFKRYVKGSNFNMLLGDTTYSHLANGTTSHSFLFFLRDSTDYQIILRQSVTYSITNTNLALRKCDNCPSQYDAYITTSYDLNGVPVNNSTIIINK